MYDNYQEDFGMPLFTKGRVALYKDMKSPPIKWLVQDVFKEHGIGILFGGSGSMKSYAAVDLACRMTNGMDFNGKALEHGNVIYIAGEASDETNERITAWLRFYNKTERPLVCPWAVQIHKTDEMNDLADLIEQVGNVRLVIFDNLADCSVGVKLNDPDDVGEHLKPAVLSFVKQTKAAMLMLHHTGHNERDERGAKVLRDMTDTSIKAVKQTNKFDLVWTLKKVRRRQAEGEELHFHIKDISAVVDIDNAAVLVAGKRTPVGDVVEEAALVPENVLELRNSTDRLEHYLEQHGGEADAIAAQVELGWRKDGSNKPSQTYYDALNGSDRISKQGRLLVLIPEEAKLEQEYSGIAV